MGESNFTRDEFIGRYLYQILHGCDDDNCKQSFCRRNQKLRFQGDYISSSAAITLACQLIAAKGSDALCESLKQSDLPDLFSQLIDIDDPYNSPILKESNHQTSNKKRTADSLEYSLCHSKVFKSDITRPIYESVVNFSTSLLKGINARLNLTSKNTTFEDATDDKTESAKKSEKNQKEFHLTRNKNTFNGKSLLYHSFAHLTSLDDKLQPLIEPRMTKFWKNLEITNESKDTHKCPAPWSYYSFQNPCYYWPSSLPVANSSTVDKIYKKQSRKNIIYGLNDRNQALFRTYTNAEGYGVNLADISNGSYNWSEQDLRLAFIRIMYSVLSRLASLKSSIESSTTFTAMANKLDPDWEQYELRYYNISCGDVAFHMSVDRSRYLASSIECLKRALEKEDMILRPIVVSFSTEMSQDLGGVQQEFFGLLGSELVNSGYGLFVNEDSNYMWFNSAYTGDPIIYEYIGMLVGLGLYNQCPVGVRFPPSFYKLLQYRAELFPKALDIDALLNELDPIQKKNIERLTVNDDLDDWRFERTYQLDFGEIETIKLPSYDKYDGEVTPENLNIFKKEYKAEYCLGRRRRFIIAFIDGFHCVVHKQLARKVHYTKLHQLIEGKPTLTATDLYKNIKYRPNEEKSPTIERFWNIVKTFNPEQLESLLRFLTGSIRLPINGHLPDKITVVLNGNINNLPTSSTCTGDFYLPQYETEEKMHKMLLKALEYSVGFGLV